MTKFISNYFNFQSNQGYLKCLLTISFRFSCVSQHLTLFDLTPALRFFALSLS